MKSEKVQMIRKCLKFSNDRTTKLSTEVAPPLLNDPTHRTLRIGIATTQSTVTSQQNAQEVVVQYLETITSSTQMVRPTRVLNLTILVWMTVARVSVSEYSYSPILLCSFVY